MCEDKGCYNLGKPFRRASELELEEEKYRLNDTYYYNIMLGKSLVQLLPASDRQIIRVWFERLAEANNNVEEMRKRNEYIWFILMMMQNNKIVQYFKQLPPCDIIPLRSVISQNTMDEIVLTNEENMAWLNTINKEHAGDEKRARTIPPENFLDTQPVPQEGLICYMSAFSDHT